MIPREYRLMPELPRNANGKVDRKALLAMLEDRE
jgi:acyl-coenzyme A synthetase/AMP-(fatty) acid ligase